MNLPNKLTLSRIVFIPIFMLFVLPFPEWVINANFLSFMHDELVAVDNFIKNPGNYIGAIIFIILASTDKVDGYIARKRKQVTKLGIFLDPIADKLLITAAMIALVQRQEMAGWAAMFIIAREFIVTGFRLVAAGENIILPADRWGKIKMVVQTVAIAASLLKNFPLTLFTDIPFDRYAMFIAVIITLGSGFNYVWKNRNVLGTDI